MDDKGGMQFKVPFHGLDEARRREVAKEMYRHMYKEIVKLETEIITSPDFGPQGSVVDKIIDFSKFKNSVLRSIREKGKLSDSDVLGIHR